MIVPLPRRSSSLKFPLEQWNACHKSHSAFKFFKALVSRLSPGSCVLVIPMAVLSPGLAVRDTVSLGIPQGFSNPSTQGVSNSRWGR
jgi:hypothetical protein